MHTLNQANPRFGLHHSTQSPRRAVIQSKLGLRATPSQLLAPNCPQRAARRCVRPSMAMAASGSNRVDVPLSELRELCTKSLKTLGYPADEVKVLLEVCSIAAAPHALIARHPMQVDWWMELAGSCHVHDCMPHAQSRCFAAQLPCMGSVYHMHVCAGDSHATAAAPSSPGLAALGSPL